ncbi:MAG: hypothetical protein NVS9B7_05810 [Flavisolibacter sp.]
MKKIENLSLLFLVIIVVAACNNKGTTNSSTPDQKDSISRKDTMNTKNPNTSGAQNAPTY